MADQKRVEKVERASTWTIQHYRVAKNNNKKNNDKE
jgi:hypothetical protein